MSEPERVIGATVWVVQRVDLSHGDELLSIFSSEADAQVFADYWDDPSVSVTPWEVRTESHWRPR